MEKYTIIVAGGKGLRMGYDLPKQFIPIGGKPILMHTMDAFYAYDENIRMILVLPKEQQVYWRELCEKYHYQRSYQLADGGETRFHSVKNGLSLVSSQETALVGVHDGVRPFVSSAVIAGCYEEAALRGAVIPVTDVVETIRRQTTNTTGYTVDRNEYKLVQTPQVFSLNLLKRAYDQEFNSKFTDDASVVESLGEKVFLVSGNRENIKITTPFDLKIAETLLQNV